MDLTLPHLGEGADSGTVVNIFVKEGDQITKDQPILELENEKAVATIPANSSGTVTKLFVKTGDKINVGQRILTLTETDGEPPAKEKKSAAAPARPTKEEKEEAKTPEPEKPEPKEEPAQETRPGVGPAA